MNWWVEPRSSRDSLNPHRTGVFVLAVIALLRPEPALAEKPAGASDICSISSDAKKHVGERVTFRGIFESDVIERATIAPLGCALPFRVGVVPASVSKLLDAHTPPWFYPRGPIEAVFTGALVQRQPNDAQFLKDDGVRLDVSDAERIKR
jgi:hypothetical protein